MQGQKIATAFLELGVDDKKLDRDMSHVKQKVNSSFAELGAAAASGFASYGLGKFVGFGLRMARETEVAKIGFEVLTGSAEQGLKTFNELRAFSDVTPFKADEVQIAGKKLLAAGVDADQLTEKLGFLGDASAAVGARLSEVTQIYAKIQNQNKLTGETFEQLAERSINLMPVIMEMLGLTADEFKKMQSDGEITADIVDKAFKKMNSEGGKFFGAMDKLSVTLEGRLSTLSSKFDQIAETIGNAIAPAVKVFVDVAIMLGDAFLALNPQVQQMIGFMVALTPAILGSVAAFKLLKIASIAAGISIRTALISTGIGAVVVLVGFLVAKLIELAQTVDVTAMPAFQAFRGVWDKITRAAKVFWDAVKTIFSNLVRVLGDAFQAIGKALWDTFGWMLTAVGNFVMGAINFIAEFVLDAAEWFNVIVNNWGTVLELMGQGWSLLWSTAVDVLLNFFPAAFDAAKGFVESLIDLFAAIPDAIAALFSGGIEDALDTLFATATANFMASQAAAFDKLLKPSEESVRLRQQFNDTLTRLKGEKAKLEGERTSAEDSADDAKDSEKAAEDAADEQKKDEKKKDKDAIKFGSVGVAEFQKEVQDMLFNQSEEKDKQDKIIGLNQNQLDVQQDQLDATEKIEKHLEGAAIIKTAGN